MIRDRYPGADVLAQRGHWDEATRRVVMDRVRNVPRFRFFTEHERDVLQALCARVVPQDHRPPDRFVPIAPWIDQRCANGTIDGFQFDDMPRNEEAWRIGLLGVDQTAQHLFGRGFTELGEQEQDDVLQAVRGGHPEGEAWKRLNVHRFWLNVALRQIVGIYYAHPYAWDEIGFGGPAYPRGYAALNHGAREPWETPEVSS
ncbi:MAG: gluconate 2-dehydrogenase subunit 3 family protein [Actinomycetota bacterium]|nr:gluconate 2-dehydrogenase subunit 3 family protein [Actinomycetota bacterium]